MAAVPELKTHLRFALDKLLNPSQTRDVRPQWCYQFVSKPHGSQSPVLPHEERTNHIFLALHDVLPQDNLLDWEMKSGSYDFKIIKETAFF
jgi:hypothetical protein